MYESGRIKRDAERETNRKIRAKLSKLSGMAFPTELIMAPEAPEMLSKTPAGTPANLAKDRKAAWTNVEGAKAAWTTARLQLLSDQDDYNAGKKGVRIGDSMRSVTRAEIDIARAAGDYRLIEARIAIATKKPLAKVLGAL